MKTIYINESALTELKKNNILLKELPLDLVGAINSNKTSFGNNPAFPDIYDDNFLQVCAENYFKEVKQRLKDIKKIDYIKTSSLKSALSEMMLKCKEEEADSKEQLEKLCINKVVDIFGIPKDMIDLEVNLVEKVQVSPNVDLDKIKDIGNYDNISKVKEFRSEIYKRTIINALCIGYGLDYSNNIKNYASDLYEINPKLPVLYRDILALNSYLLFTENDLSSKMTMDNNMMGGFVNVIIGDVNNKVKIQAQGTIFPILLAETIRGLMELFASHGLPNDNEIAKDIIKRTDYLKAEPWYMIFGEPFWKLLTQTDNIKSTKEIPYIFKRICSLNVEDFNRFMEEVFAGTKDSKEMMKELRLAAYNDFKEDKNQTDGEVDKQDIEPYIITDEFIKEELF